MSIHIEFLKVRFGRISFARSRKLRSFCLSAVHLLIILSMILSIPASSGGYGEQSRNGSGGGVDIPI